MTVPRDRVSFGSHAFPFAGLRDDDGSLRTLPSLPIRIRQSGRQWSVPIDAILDTASTRTILPLEVADHLGIVRGTRVEEVGGAGAPFEVADAVSNLAIVDASYPMVTCWEVTDAPIWVARETGRLAAPVMGWDILGLFRITLDPRDRWIEMRLLHE